MSNMSEIDATMRQFVNLALSTGEVVSKKEYERLAACVSRMLSITEECINRMPNKEASFKRDVRVYMKIGRAHV